jgi:hypothetical protein
MLAFFGTTAIVIAALTAPTAPVSPDAVLAASAAPVAAATAAAPPKHRGRQQQAITVDRPAPPTDEQVIRQQLELRVLMPPLSGDGGG